MALLSFAGRLVHFRTAVTCGSWRPTVGVFVSDFTVLARSLPVVLSIYEEATPRGVFTRAAVGPAPAVEEILEDE